MLEVIGVWPAIEGMAEPMRRIELTDSPRRAGQADLINLDSEKTPGGEPTAYIIENAHLLRALIASLEGAKNVRVFAPDSVSSFEAEDQTVEIKLRSGATLDAKVLVAADGRNSELRAMAGIRTTVWSSDKVGIVATVGIEIPHEGVARQHFLPAGPFAILPMTGNRVSIVWTEEGRAAKANPSARTGRTALAELSRRFGPELGALTLLSEPKTFPLTTTLARDFVRPRFVLVGDAAHGLHWIAGQGLNHGLKDVAALAETLIDGARLEISTSAA